MLPSLLALLLAAPASAGTIEVGAAKPRSRLEEIRLMLDYAIWNPRVSAVYDLGELGPDALPLLVYASDDADWQVRQTAVHFLGKAGSGAAGPLFEVAKREPCHHVRLLALSGLSKLGREGEALYREVLTPEDERELTEMPMPAKRAFGRPVVIDAPQGDMTKEFFDGVFVDPRVCASSERAGRLRRHLKWPRGKEKRNWSNEVVVTPEVTVGRDLKREAFEREEREYEKRELALSWPERRDKKDFDEILGAGEPGFGDRVVEKGDVAYAKTEREALKRRGPEAPLPKNTATAETMPPGAPGISHEGPERGKAEIVADKGRGKVPFDPLANLMKRLKSPEARTRARAADELGKRGRSASAAAPALRDLLKDKDRRVRASAALALGSAGGGLNGVEKDLERARRDPDEDVRFSALTALRRLRGE